MGLFRKQNDSDTPAVAKTADKVNIPHGWISLPQPNAVVNLLNAKAIAVIQVIPNADGSRFRLKMATYNGHVLYTDPVSNLFEAYALANDILKQCQTR